MVRSINDAGWALLEISEGSPTSVTMLRVTYDIETIATAIRATDGLPDHYALDIERGGAKA